MKLNILFVDDEKNIILGFKRMLRVLKENWEFYFAQSASEALEIMEKVKIDVIISDMRMPQMNGAELLTIVKKKYPSTIRIILSGQSNEKLALEAIKSAHQFIAKPIEPEILKQTIQESFNLHLFLDNENLRKVINGINRLPSLPKTYYEVEKELSKENFSLQEVAKIISNDMVMSAKILQVVNSAFFGLPQKTSSVTEAVNFLGANILKSLIIYVQVFKSYEGNEQTQQLLTNVWNHSLQVAKNSKKILSKLENNVKDAETAYNAGLLHDIGKIVILSSDKYRSEILDKMKLSNLTYNEAEREILKTTHAEVGGYLLKLWGLPNTVIETVLHHHNSSYLEKETNNILTAVYLANVLAETSEVEEEFIKKIGLENRVQEIIDLCYN